MAEIRILCETEAPEIDPDTEDVVDVAEAEWLEVHSLQPCVNAGDDGGDFVRVVETTDMTRYYMTAPWPVGRKFYVAFVGEAFSGYESSAGHLWLSLTNENVAEGESSCRPGDDFIWRTSLEALSDDWTKQIMKARRAGPVDLPNDTPATEWRITDLGDNNVTFILDEHGTRNTITLHDLQKFFDQCADVLTLMSRHRPPPEWGWDTRMDRRGQFSG